MSHDPYSAENSRVQPGKHSKPEKELTFLEKVLGYLDEWRRMPRKGEFNEEAAPDERENIQDSLR